MVAKNLQSICEVFGNARLYNNDQLMATDTDSIIKQMDQLQPSRFCVKHGIVFLFQHCSGGEELLPYSIELINQDA